MNSNQQSNDFHKQDGASTQSPKKQIFQKNVRIAIGCLVVLVVLLVADIVGLSLHLFFGDRDPIANRIPNNAQMYVSVNFLTAKSENIDRIISVFEDIRGGEQDQTMTEMLDKTLSSLDMNFDSDILPWVGTHTGVALRGLKDGSSEPEFIGIIEVKNKAKADQFVQDFIRAMERNGVEKFDKVQKDRVTLYVQQSSHEPMVLARTGSYLYISNSESFACHSINASKKGSLASSEAYKKTVAALPGDPFMTAFFDGHDLQQLSDSIMDDTMGPATIIGKDAVDDLLGLAMGVSAEDVGLRLDVAVAFDETKLNISEERAVTATYGASSFDHFVPGDTFLFTTFNSSQNLGTILDSDNPSLEDVNESLQLLEKETDISLLDLSDLLGGEFGIAVGPARDGLPSESADMSVGVSLLASTNNEQDLARWFDNTINSLSKNMSASIDSNGISIGDVRWREVVIQNPSSGEVMPALYYRISDQHVILSTSLNNLEIAMEQDQTLSNDETYQDTWKAFPRGSYPMLYISVERLADWAQDAYGSSLDSDVLELSRNADRIPIIAMSINPSPKYTRSFSLIIFIE